MSEIAEKEVKSILIFKFNLFEFVVIASKAEILMHHTIITHVCFVE